MRSHFGIAQWIRHLSAILAALWLAVYCPAPAAYAKDNPEDFTRVYQHSYDEVWDATHEAIERLGWSVTSDDKDKGTITGYGLNETCPGHRDFSLHVETVSSKPETRVTANVTWHGLCGKMGGRQWVATKVLTEIPKVLATYK